jgi:hypothetical protein
MGKRTKTKSAPDLAQPRAGAHCHSQVFFFVVLWTILFFVIHIVTSVQVWDRYLLPVAPVLALLIGYLAGRWTTNVAFPLMAGALVLWFCVLTPPALTAARGQLPIGGDHGAYTGLAEVVAWLQQEAPDDVVLYHHVLGWNFRFYLYEQIATGRYDLRWFPSTTYLADNAAKTPHKLRLLMEPDWAPLPNLSAIMAIRGFALHKHKRFGHFTILEIADRSQGFCPWCLCKLQHSWPALTSSGDASRMSLR